MADITINNETKIGVSLINESQNSVSISKESKNSLSVSNFTKTSVSVTWDEAVFTWDESYPSTWDSQRIPLTRGTKNSVTITNESKN